MDWTELLNERRALRSMAFRYALLPVLMWLALLPMMALITWLWCPDRVGRAVGLSVVVPLGAMVYTVPDAMWRYWLELPDLQAQSRLGDDAAEK